MAILPEAELEELTEELVAIQEELRTLAAERVQLVQENVGGDRIAELDDRMAELRQRRNEIQDRQLAIQRGLSGDEIATETGDAASSMTTVAQEARSPRSRRRRWIGGLLTFTLVMALVVVLGVGLLWGVTQFLGSPAVEGVDEVQAIEQKTIEEPKSLGQRLVGLYLALNRDKLTQPAGTDDTPIIFTVEEGETAATIARRLETEGLIVDANLFRRLVAYRGADQSLAVGTYQLRATMTMDEIILALQSGRPEEIAVTIPEGWRAEEIATRLEAVGLFPADTYLALVAEPTRFQDEFSFLRELPPGATLEGFLFPDTYRVVAEEITPQDFIRMQLHTFDRRVSPALREAMAQRDMTVYEALILASLVEREAVVDEERALIAGVFENRWRDGMLLNADPTVQYALGYQAEAETWWKRPLLLEDLEIDSPYNTYKYAGLPPGPICNPGLAAIRATATAPGTDYYYFVARGDGTHVFAETLEEHQQNVERYRR